MTGNGRIAGRVLRPVAVATVVIIATAAAVNTAFALGRTVDASAAGGSGADVILGAYTGPAAEGLLRMKDWERWSGIASPYALDFAAGDSWPNIVGPAWLLAPWRDAGRRLIYSLPLITTPGNGTAEPAADQLRRCADGGYDDKWTELGRNLMSNNLPTTIVRPGWEFNGSWYGWAAKDRQTDYIECFQHVVRAMRTVPGQQFQFIWCPAVGDLEFPAEQAYPGNEFVDYVGVDVYDESWLPGTYPYASEDPAVRQNAANMVWADILTGAHGLRFWSSFAKSNGRPFVIPEWGLSKRFDGHGGADNPIFVNNMLDYLTDPSNNVAFAMYFDFDTAGHGEHMLSPETSAFPQSRRVMSERLRRISR